jgi:hypothetical protein
MPDQLLTILPKVLMAAARLEANQLSDRASEMLHS